MNSPGQVYCVLDFETYSEANLKKTGSFEYSVHPSTDIICVAWRIGTRGTLPTTDTNWWAPTMDYDSGSFAELLRALRDPKIVIVAHNALFEQVITANVLGPKYMRSKASELKIAPSRWICTAALAAALALPRRLEGACEALKLPVQKDKEGNRLVLKWCKPRKPTKKDPSTRHDDPEELMRIIRYCITDVDAEVGLFLRCPPLSPTERKVWELDQKINLRGFLVDRPLVETTLKLIGEEKGEIDQETIDISWGIVESATQRAGVLNWLKNEHVFLENLQKKTVESVLQEGLVWDDPKRMLELRLAISKTSTAKYEAFELRSRHDARLRDILMYWGASTGRWGGKGVQPQNFPRGSIKDTIQAAGILREGDLELLRLIYGDPMSVFSSCLRNMIVAPQGCTLDVADYAAIEARVLFWVARHEDGMRAFRENRDLYREQAAEIFGKPLDKINSFERFVGKSVILGCGYQMAGKKFAASCKLQGQDVGQDIADLAVKSYRTTHAPVVKLWSNIGHAAVVAVQNPTKKYTINRTQWFVEGGFLYCALPSGRRLAYYGPTVVYETTPWGEKRPCLYHWGVNSLSKKWELQKTYGGRLVENVVQAISRDLMAEAMLRIEARGPWNIVLSVHDELIAERDLKKGGSIEEFNQLMAELPTWAEGCPVKVEGFSGTRYRK